MVETSSLGKENLYGGNLLENLEFISCHRCRRFYPLVHHFIVGFCLLSSKDVFPFLFLVSLRPKMERV